MRPPCSRHTDRKRRQNDVFLITRLSHPNKQHPPACLTPPVPSLPTVTRFLENQLSNNRLSAIVWNTCRTRAISRCGASIRSARHEHWHLSPTCEFPRWQISMHVAHERLISLDAFRGLTIALMILVNMPGSWSHVYAPLAHAEWFGWTPTDLVFPFFLFIVGASMVFSPAKRRAEGTQAARLYTRMIRRSAIIFILGVLLNIYPSLELSTLRLTGVLQRIAMVYLSAAIIVCRTDIRAQVWITAMLLVVYWGLMVYIPVSGLTSGNLTPQGNLAGWLDRTIFRATRLSAQPDRSRRITEYPTLSCHRFNRCVDRPLAPFRQSKT